MRLRARPVGIAKVDRRVEFGLREQEGPGTGCQIDARLRVGREKARQPWQQPAGGEGWHHRQLNAAPAGVVAHDRQGIPLDGIEPARHLAAVAQAGIGELHASTGALEQGHTDKFFKAGNLPADRTLSEREFFRGAGEAFVAGRGFEGDERTSAGDFASHDLPAAVSRSEIFAQSGANFSVVPLWCGF